MNYGFGCVKPKGMVSLTATACVQLDEANHSFALLPSQAEDERRHYFKCANNRELVEWVECINMVVTYLKVQLVVVATKKDVLGSDKCREREVLAPKSREIVMLSTMKGKISH
jgi:hypothetical protein